MAELREYTVLHYLSFPFIRLCRKPPAMAHRDPQDIVYTAELEPGGAGGETRWFLRALHEGAVASVVLRWCDGEERVLEVVRLDNHLAHYERKWRAHELLPPYRDFYNSIYMGLRSELLAEAIKQIAPPPETRIRLNLPDNPYEDLDEQHDYYLDLSFRDSDFGLETTWAELQARCAELDGE